MPNPCTFSIQKLVLSVKESNIPVRGRNQGPSINFLIQEDGFSLFLLEDGNGAILLEVQP